MHGRQWSFEDSDIRTQAYATQGGAYIVSGMQVVGERSASTQCSFWPSSSFDESNTVAEEAGNLNDMCIHGLVGVHKDRAVVLDRELWVCTKAHDDEGDPTQHFYVPFDWLNTSEERPAIMTVLGEFVYAKHGELIIVKRGMRCKQDFYLMSPALTHHISPMII